MNSDPFKVNNPYRTEVESSTVIVEYLDGKVSKYEKIKEPWAYIKALKKNPTVKRAWVQND